MSVALISYLYSTIVGGLIPDELLTVIQGLNLTTEDAIQAYLEATDAYSGSRSYDPTSNILYVSNINPSTYHGCDVGNGSIACVTSANSNLGYADITFNNIASFRSSIYIEGTNGSNYRQTLNMNEGVFSSSLTHNGFNLVNKLYALRPYTNILLQEVVITNTSNIEFTLPLTHIVESTNTMTNTNISNSLSYHNQILSSNTRACFGMDTATAIGTAYLFGSNLVTDYHYRLANVANGVNGVNGVNEQLVNQMNITIPLGETVTLDFMSAFEKGDVDITGLKQSLNIVSQTDISLLKSNHIAYWADNSSDIKLVVKDACISSDPISVAKVANLNRQVACSLYSLNSVNLMQFNSIKEEIEFELYTMPVLLYIRPKLARSVVHTHFLNLNPALINSIQNGFSVGSLYGGNLTLSTLIAINCWNYYRATHDTDWLQNEGIAILRQVADLVCPLCNLVKNSWGKITQIGLSLSAGISSTSSSTGQLEKEILPLLIYSAIWYAVEAYAEIGLPPRPIWLTIYNATYTTYTNITQNLILQNMTNWPYLAYFPLNNMVTAAILTNTIDDFIKNNYNHEPSTFGLNSLTLAALYAQNATASTDITQQTSLLTSNINLLQTFTQSAQPPFYTLNRAADSQFILNILQPWGTLAIQGGINVNRFCYTDYHVTCRALSQAQGNVLPSFIKSLTITNVGLNENTYSIVNPLLYS